MVNDLKMSRSSEFREEGVEEDAELKTDVENVVEDKDAPWEVRFARFKKEQQREQEDEDQVWSDVDTEKDSEAVDRVSRLPVINGKRRRKGAGSASSGFSMTSSAIYRNAGLTLLDEKFEQVCLMCI
jgi:protein LTV1